MNKEGTTEKEGKYKHKYSCIALSNTWLALSCLLACVVALWSTQTYCCYEYVLCCSVQGRLNAVLLCLRYVDTVAFGAWFVPSWCAQKKSRFKNIKFVAVFLGGHMANGANDTASFDCEYLFKKSTSPAVMFTSRLVLASPMTWTEKSACVENLPRSHIHNTRALPAAVMVV